MSGYDFRNVNGHIEVYLNGVFQFSEDTEQYARHELGRQEEERCGIW